jgi:hypothetical protein
LRSSELTPSLERVPQVHPSILSFALSAIALGHALQISNGFYDVTALAWVVASLVLCLAGATALRVPSMLPRSGYALLCAVIVAGIIWQLAALYDAQPGFYLGANANLRPLKAGVILQAVLIAVGICGIRRARHFWFPAVLAVNLGLGVWMLKASPDPHIDVVTIHREAIDALLQRKDPYRISMENIYGADSHYYYNRDAIVGKRVAIAYPYPPVSLLLAVPGQALAGDYRYAELAALIIGAALIGFARRGVASRLAACLLLTTPRGLFVLEQGWTEPIAIMLLAATVFLLQRGWLSAAVAAGMLIVTKQYLVLAGPPFLKFVLGQPKRRWLMLLLLAGLAAAAVTLPLALWHPNAFLKNVVWLQTREPFRGDSLSVLSWAAREGWGNGSFWWAIGAALIALVVGLLGTPNTASGFAAAVALSCLAMFVFGSKAFCNYYYYVIGALCCAVTAGLDTAGRAPES